MNGINFDKPNPGFYIEGQANPDCFYGYVTFISGQKKIGFQREEKIRMPGIIARKWTHSFLISQEETIDWQQLSDEDISGILKHENVPELFIRWCKRIMIQNNFRDEPSVSPEYREWNKQFAGKERELN